MEEELCINSEDLKSTPDSEDMAKSEDVTKSEDMEDTRETPKFASFGETCQIKTEPTS